MRYVGVMTGTSVDGLDIALVDMSPQRGEREGACPLAWESPQRGEREGAGASKSLPSETSAVAIAEAATIPFPAALAQDLRKLCSPGADDVARVGAADARLGDFIGTSVAECLCRWGVPPRDVRAIGCHGQTIRHHPSATPPFTVQIGDANRVAEITGIDTVADFRRRDIAAGGEGAPLAPLFHTALFRDATRHRAVVNIGGIANATLLAAGSPDILGFDTGPGNALLDAWIRRCKGDAYDRDGAWARTGSTVPDLLRALQADPFIAREPPKSTGKETYHLGYVEDACRRAQELGEASGEYVAVDVQATLAEFTAWSIAEAVRRWRATLPATSSRDDVVLCGGGRRNAYLVERLAAHLDGQRLATTDDLGIDGDALEAAAFAWFAHRTLEKLPSNAPTVTGASGARVLGAVYFGAPARP